MQNHSHLIEIDEKQRRLTIYRISESGQRSLYTYVDLPPKARDDDREAYERFVKLLGENILVDSPVARKLMGLG